MKKMIVAVFALLLSLSQLQAVSMTAPINRTASLDMAPAVTVKMPEAKVKALWDINFSFDASSAAQAGIETDGTFIYTSTWNVPGTFNKYTAAGVFVETFTIAGAGAVRDMAYDGQYFYGGAAAAAIYQMDFTNKTLVSTINCPAGTGVRHISYDPLANAGAGGFWVGNWADLKLVSKTGALLSTGPVVANVYGSAYDNVTAGGPFIWLYAQAAPTNVALIKYDIAANTISDIIKTTDDIPGFNAASAGGLCTSSTLVPGKTLLIGSMQQDPNKIFGYELASSGTVTDTTAPTVVSVGGINAAANTPMAVTLVVSDESDVAATIDAVYNIGAGDVTITMTKNTKNNYTYTGSIPAQAAGVTGTVKFHVADLATPTANSAWTSTYNISWATALPPILGAGESFEGTAFPPEGWTVINADGAGKTWESFATAAHTGANVAKHGFGASGYDENGMLITPAITIAADAAPTLNFWEQDVWPSDYVYHGVWVSETDAQPASFVELAAVPVAPTAPEWGEKVIDLSAYKGKTIYLGFKYTGIFADSWHIDDVKVVAGPDIDFPVAAAPTGTPAYLNAPMNVSTVVTDATGIASVVCQYKLDGQTAWTDVAMTASKVSGTYTCTLPAQAAAINGLVKFKTTDTVTPTPNQGVSDETPIAWIVQPDEILYDFEAGIPTDWTLLDADGDTFNWTTEPPVAYAVHNGVKGLHSASFYNAPGPGAVTPDNFIILPKKNVLAGAYVKYWVSAQDAAYAGEHYGIGVSTTGTAAADFTMIFEETMTAKAQGAWYERTVNIPATFVGQNIHVAIRHWNCTDMFWLNIDDFVTSKLDPVGIEAGLKPAASSLSQNYPNPFNPTTTINFTNKFDGAVKLTVMNAKGESVATLVNSNLTAGSHSVNFDGAKLNSGLYFYKLETADATITQKMLLVK